MRNDDSPLAKTRIAQTMLEYDWYVLSKSPPHSKCSAKYHVSFTIQLLSQLSLFLHRYVEKRESVQQRCVAVAAPFLRAYRCFSESRSFYVRALSLSLCHHSHVFPINGDQTPSCTLTPVVQLGRLVGVGAAYNICCVSHPRLSPLHLNHLLRFQHILHLVLYTIRRSNDFTRTFTMAVVRNFCNTNK